MIENIDWSKLISVLVDWGPRLIVAALIVVGGLLLARLTQSMVLRWGRTLGIDDIQWVAGLTRMGILLATGLVALQHLGVDVGLLTALIAVVAGALAGSVALALALGGQRIVGDILGAYHLKKLFHPGQRLKVAGQEGVLREITTTGLVLENDEGQIHVSGATAFESIVVRLREEK
jgi:hypothetical protein